MAIGFAAGCRRANVWSTGHCASIHQMKSLRFRSIFTSLQCLRLPEARVEAWRSVMPPDHEGHCGASVGDAAAPRGEKPRALDVLDLLQPPVPARRQHDGVMLGLAAVGELVAQLSGLPQLDHPAGGGGVI